MRANPPASPAPLCGASPLPWLRSAACFLSYWCFQWEGAAKYPPAGGGAFVPHLILRIKSCTRLSRRFWSGPILRDTPKGQSLFPPFFKPQSSIPIKNLPPSYSFFLVFQKSAHYSSHELTKGSRMGLLLAIKIRFIGNCRDTRKDMEMYPLFSLSLRRFPESLKYNITGQ
jgi:hypothetical protein